MKHVEVTQANLPEHDRFSEHALALFAGGLGVQPIPSDIMGTDFAQRLNALFAAVPAPDGRPFTNEAVISGIAERGGDTISKGYLSELRSGKKDNPTLRHIEALADFFGVDPAYFVADQARADEITEQIRLVRAMGDAGVQGLALRASEMSPKNFSLIEAMIEQVLKIEGEPDDDRRD